MTSGVNPATVDILDIRKSVTEGNDALHENRRMNTTNLTRTIERLKLICDFGLDTTFTKLTTRRMTPDSLPLVYSDALPFTCHSEIKKWAADSQMSRQVGSECARE